MNKHTDPTTPKIDLHCHLDGSLPITSVRRLASRAGITLPQEDEALRTLMEAPADCTSLETYLERFSLPVACMQTAENLYEAARDVLLSAAEEGVVYMELRFAPLQHLQMGLTVKEVLEHVISGAREAEEKINANAKAPVSRFGIIICGMRHEDVRKNIAMLEEAMPFYGKGVCALDIAGAETPFPPKTQEELFREAQHLGIPYTIHAGECGSWENVMDAIDLGASRIGHGIAIAKNPAAMETCVSLKIPLELCPVSNFQTKAVERPGDYPLRTFLDAGVCVTINTDNRTVSGTSLTRETDVCRKIAGLTPDEERMLYENAVNAAFASAETKQKLMALSALIPDSAVPRSGPK